MIDPKTDAERVAFQCGKAMANHFAKQFNYALDHKIETGSIDFLGICDSIIEQSLRKAIQEAYEDAILLAETHTERTKRQIAESIRARMKEMLER